MGRTLPWLAPTAGRRCVEKRSDHLSNKHANLRSTPADEDSDVEKPLRSKHTTTLRKARTPSTSPPPAPPHEELMHNGFDKDDIFIMVEDELLSVAKLFTQHLHHAEYVRMKEQARARKSALGEIPRPTDTRTPMGSEVKRRKVRETKRKKYSDAFAKLKEQDETSGGPFSRDGNNDDDDESLEVDPWVGTSLKGLMSDGKRSRISLTRMPTMKHFTKANPRVGQEPREHHEARQGNTKTNHKSREMDDTADVEATTSEEDDDDDDDNLDTSTVRPVSSHYKNPAATTATATAIKVLAIEPPIPGADDVTKPPRRVTTNLAHPSSHNGITIDSDFDDHIFRPTELSNSRSTRRRK